MSLADHLREFRKRLILAAIGIALGMVAGWFLYTPVFEGLQAPVLAVAERNDALVTVNFSGVATALDMQLKVSVLLGVVISAPWWLYQLWAFVAPGLKRTERRYTIGFLGAAIPLFFSGVVLAWWVFPKAIDILISFTPEGAANLLDAQTFMTFAMRLVIAFGLAFVFPVVMIALTWVGVVKARTWLKGWRWAVFLIFLAAAILTPTPDAVTMLFMAGPMVALYFAAVGVGLARERAVRRRTPEEERLA
ncbi:twin-arginine translocase subunit TatC [Demequina sp. SYSU T00039]|uniref:Sec-independent protein translocase protein TatC n=1 Tax=Demequina lignilytica TaxID=3051663 RepID=A0AAW7M7L9_9MICO|nr:twin-arginine translocase subunit TatC [Demequina sp. SYSU T00039]MDN4486671.1 twin-arginine translocase subunit TatC [Demequina sp. SYSU T00039]